MPSRRYVEAGIALALSSLFIPGCGLRRPTSPSPIPTETPTQKAARSMAGEVISKNYTITRISVEPNDDGSQEPVITNLTLVRANDTLHPLRVSIGLANENSQTEAEFSIRNISAQPEAKPFLFKSETEGERISAEGLPILARSILNLQDSRFIANTIEIHGKVFDSLFFDAYTVSGRRIMGNLDTRGLGNVTVFNKRQD